MFTVDFRTKDGADIPLANGLQSTPQWFSRSTRGGCLQADIEVRGDINRLWSLFSLLGKRVVIRNSDYHPVWWGYIEEAFVSRGELLDGLSLRDMYNRVRVAYSYEDFGAPASGITDWAVNGASIDALLLVKELMETTEISATPAMADARRDTLLARIGLPIPVTGEAQDREGEPVALLHCAGDIFTFGWKYYAQPRGLEEHAGGDTADQPLGLGITSAAWGFNLHGRIYDMQGRLNNFPTGVRIAISGTSSNNGVRTVKNVDRRPPRSYTSDGISFDAPDDIYSVDADLGFVEVDDFIHVSGATHAQNNGYKQVKTVSGGHLEIRPQSNFPAGSPPWPETTISRGNYIETEESGTTEFPSDGQTVTLVAHGIEVAQSFRTAGDWTVAQVELRVKKVGALVDGLSLNICADDGGEPGTILESATIAAAEITTDFTTGVFQFSNTLMLQQDVTYWLQVQRTGGYSISEYYVVEVDEQAGYTDGSLMLWSGVSWIPRTPNASLMFRVLGAWETTRQIREVVAACGQYVTTTDIQVSSGLFTNQYRPGDAVAYDELMALICAGTDDNTQLVLDITSELILQVYAEPPDTAINIQQTPDGRWLDIYGRPLVEGMLPVGQWVARSDIPSAAAVAYRLSPQFVEEAEYDCIENRIRSVRFRGTPDPDELLGI
ncbi:MAG: hypothetical protein DCC55_11310 [Chloroflexi bacterium]|nr:MAG: hypothetical protein DCC55_11310 [Chloroflexota bacterium]